MIRLFFILIFATNYCVAQNIDYNDFRYKGLSFFSSKTEIETVLGKPNDFFYPNYECGFLSGDEEEMDFSTLEYDDVKFTGNDSQKYLIEKISFEKNDVKLNYKKHILSNKATIKEFNKTFKNAVSFDVDNVKQFYLQCDNCDDRVFFEFKNDMLISFYYWSPC